MTTTPPRVLVAAFPGALAAVMDRKGLSTRDVSRITADLKHPGPKVSHALVHQHMHPGRYGATIDLPRAQSIADALEVDVADLFAYPDGTPIGGM